MTRHFAEQSENGPVCVCKDLGLIDAGTIEKRMNTWRDLILNRHLPELILFMTHPVCVTIGLRHHGRPDPPGLLVPLWELKARKIPYIENTRGGGITFHWPGQLICYPMLKLEGPNRNIPEYMSLLEKTCKKTLRDFHIMAEPRRDTPSHIGLWINNKKIVSMGVRISGWITMFGFAINLGDPDSMAGLVDPCGIKGAELTTFQETIGEAPDRELVIKSVVKNFSTVFNRSIRSWID
jgi:lipoate-protein ligase B